MRRVAWVCSVFALSIFASSADADPPTASSDQGGKSTPSLHRVDSFVALMRAFRSMPGLQAEFVEEKKLAVLSSTLKSTGTLYFEPPMRLRKEVRSPRKAVVLVSGTRLTMVSDAERQEIDLNADPNARLFVGAFVSVLAADETRLRDAYSIDFALADSNDSSWVLTMKPKANPLSALIESVVMKGRGAAVRTLVVRETNGDEATMRITNADAQRCFSKAERQAFFGSDAL